MHDLNRFRNEINSLGIRLSGFTADDIKGYLLRHDEKIDFIEFYKKHIEQLYIDNRKYTAIKRNYSLNRLIEFNKNKALDVLSINKRFINEFIVFLKTAVRIDAIERGGRSNQTITNIVSDVKVVFNELKRKYNDEDAGIYNVPGNPFGGERDIIVKESRKRNLSISVLKQIRDMKLDKEPDVISRDLFMLSFYLCGINSIDIYENLKDENIERLNYNRRKTASKRKDDS